MNWRKKLLKSFSLYVITDLKRIDSDFLEKVERSLQGGVDILQLRSKVLSDSELVRVGLPLRELTLKHKKLFIVNDRVHIARAVNADGVHLGQEDAPVSVARKVLDDSSKIIGKSTHSLEQALEAQEEGVDYIGVGPVFSTPTKPGYPPVGLSLIQEVEKVIRIPFVVIGGIEADNIREVVRAGARRVAVVRAIFGQKDTFQAAKTLKRKLSRYAMPVLQV